MGLGKTMQVIGLLAALLGKWGNGADLTELRRRKKLSAEKEMQRQAEHDRAALEGRLVGSAPFDPENDLGLPKWAPVLVILKPSLKPTWESAFREWGHFSVAAFHKDNWEPALRAIEQGAAEILLCTKSLFSAPSDFQGLSRVPFNLVVVDERNGHR